MIWFLPDEIYRTNQRLAVTEDPRKYIFGKESGIGSMVFSFQCMDEFQLELES